jgi:hypothetical protein
MEKPYRNNIMVKFLDLDEFELMISYSLFTH